jgi:hypothetical protein
VGELPTPLIVAGSVLIAAHLLAVAGAVLAAPSGPWPTPEGMGTAAPPPFAERLHDGLPSGYLRCIRMTHNYRFASNRPGLPAVYLEVRLKDREGRPLATVRFPDDNANRWVRYRQSVFARGLADDQPVAPPQGEAVAPPGRQVRSVPIWDMAGPRALRLSPVPEHLVPRDRPVFRPSNWSLVLARSYARYLCRVHGAARAEVIRHTRDPVPPAAGFLEQPPADAFEDLIANFGEFNGE